MADAFAFQAFSCEYIANILESRQRLLPEPAALHLTRRQDLLDLEMPEPDLSAYEPADSAPQGESDASADAEDANDVGTNGDPEAETEDPS